MTAPALPDIPACWAWELPPLPQPNGMSVVAKWQQDRCAICAVHMPRTTKWSQRSDGLFEDHDHATGDSRGFLCPRCNTGEGFNRHPVYALYRERNPASMLGIRSRKGCGTHPDDRSAELLLERALSEAHDRRDPKMIQYRARMAREAEQLGLTHLRTPTSPTVLALADALDRVGLTREVWWDVQSFRRTLRGGLWRGDIDDEWRYVHRVGEYANVWRPAS